jgi:hypothetical protein
MSREQMSKSVALGGIGSGAILRARIEEPAKRMEDSRQPEGPIITALEELRRVVARLEEVAPALADRITTVTSRAEDPTPDKKLSAVAGGSSPMVVEILTLAERVDMATDAVLRLMSRVEL